METDNSLTGLAELSPTPW